MARRSPRAKEEFLQFNVVYQDGSLSSNRKVASTDSDGFDEVAVKAAIEAQDRDISERSGQPRPPIKSVSRVPKK